MVFYHREKGDAKMIRLYIYLEGNTHSFWDVCAAVFHQSSEI